MSVVPAARFIYRAALRKPDALTSAIREYFCSFDYDCVENSAWLENAGSGARRVISLFSILF